MEVLTGKHIILGQLEITDHDSKFNIVTARIAE